MQKVHVISIKPKLLYTYLILPIILVTLSFISALLPHVGFKGLLSN